VGGGGAVGIADAMEAMVMSLSAKHVAPGAKDVAGEARQDRRCSRCTVPPFHRST